MTEPFVSVIIPTYNRAGVISQTIDNIFSQTYKDFELIIVDDGSTDDTQAQLREYGNRIRVVVQQNGGPAVARNRGVEVARGEIIAFQDSDDLWKPTKLERQIALLNEAGESVPCCVCNALFGTRNGKEYTSFDMACISSEYEEGLWLNVMEVLATRFVLFNQTVAIRRSAIEKVGCFDETLKYLEDYDLPLRLAMEGPWAFIRDPLVIYREGTPNSFSQMAGKDPIILKECELRIFGNALAKVREKGGNAGLERHLERRLKTFREGLRTAQLLQSPNAIPRAVGKVAKEINHYRYAAMRRTSLFPSMKTALVQKGASAGNSRATALRAS